ncbi:MAG: PASTA domain-containing protein [Intestinimonas sp.]|nr:PASTA domain-containing protein [Intestinimonas sp.]
MAIFGIVTFIPLFWKLWQIQIVNHDKYEKLAIDQQTRDLTVSAARGTIYDDRGNLLAISSTVQNVVISPKDIAAGEKDAEEKKEAGKKYNEHMNRDFIASGLADILGLNKDDILKKMDQTGYQYVVLAERVEDDISTKVRKFMSDNDLYPGVYLEPTTKRYYPYSSLAAQVIGWVGWADDGTFKGAYGIEAKYESDLAGKPGRVISAKNASGTEMLSSYENYIDAVQGYSLHLTLDATIQSYAERVLSEGITRYQVRNGGFCIVMNPKTGAIYAMASDPAYDLNNPRGISDPVLTQYLQRVQADPANNEAAYQKALQTAQYSQWRNKTLNDTYEPGSTFKCVVLAAALEEGAVSESDHFYCSGAVKVADRLIHCSKRTGHGDQTLRQAAMNSCNPAFIAIGQRLGAEKFYQYLQNFGLLTKTGIDLQGEASNQGLVWDKETFTSENGITSLATASFGQRFQITPIQLITAVSAVVNGGHLMQPYVVQSVTDSDGNTVRTTQPTEVRQVISEATSEETRSILESVVGDGGTGKNAYMAGYRIGGKTGTSETLVKGQNIVSFMGFAPADDPQVIVLLAYDSPTPSAPGSSITSDGYYISGGNMAAPMAGELIANILDYLGVQKQYSAQEMADVLVPNLVGLSSADAQSNLKSKGLTYRTVGEGTQVTGQIPAQGASIPNGSQVVLYLGAEVPTAQVEVPDISGCTLDSAQSAISNAGLYLRATGVSGYYSSSTVAISQSVTAGTMVDPGTVVEVKFVDTHIQDYAEN